MKNQGTGLDSSCNKNHCIPFLAEEYEYSSWRNDYLGLSATSVCHTQAAINRFGLDELTARVNMPLPENIVCMELDGRVDANNP